MDSTEPADSVPFGTALRQARQSAGLSLGDLARLGHYSKGYLSRIESGERRATAQLAAHCDKVLGADGALLALAPPAGSPRRSSALCLTGPIRPVQLPPPPTLFTGRERELARLDTTLTPVGRDVRVAVISGMGGVGKTALALAWAHRWSHHFTNGVLFADLCGFGPAPPTTPRDVQTAFLQALGVPAQRIPTSAAQITGLYRSVVHDRRILIVLDNAADARQIRPLLPGSPSAAVLVTSRSRLAGLCAREGALPIPLEPLSPDASRMLAAAILSEASEETLRQLTEICGHLPLALRLAAHRLAARDPAAVAAGTRGIADGRARLDLLRSPGDPDSDLRAVLQWSYDALPAATQRAIGLFATYTGADLSNHVAAVLMDTDLPSADRMLADLADVHVLHETTPGRFRFHDLFRLYAAERADPDPGALRRLGDWYVAQARAAATLIAPNMTRLPWRPCAGTEPGPGLADAEGALGFIDAERHNLLAIIELCASHGFGNTSWLLADAARGYYYQTRCMRDWVTATEIGLRMARQHADHSAIAAMLASRALSALAAGDFRCSAEFNTEALRHATKDSWTEGIAMITSNLGMACYNLGQFEQARDAYAKALATNRAIGNHCGEAVQLANLAGVHHALGEAKEALHRYGEALAIYDAAGAFESVALTHVNQANVYMTLGRPDGALAAARSALEIYGARGSRAATCLANIALARALLACGQTDVAFESAQQAYANARAIGDRRIEVDALNTLAEVAIADANIIDADGFLTAAYNIGSAIAYDLGIRDARKARRALDVARQAVKVLSSPLLAPSWSANPTHVPPLG